MNVDRASQGEAAKRYLFVGGDEGPGLGTEAVADGVLVDIMDRPADFVVRVEVNVPEMAHPGRAFAIEGVKFFGGQTFGGTAFQLVDQLFRRACMDGKNQVDMVGHDGTGMDLQLRVSDDLAESVCYS